MRGRFRKIINFFQRQLNSQSDNSSNSRPAGIDPVWYWIILILMNSSSLLSNLLNLYSKCCLNLPIFCWPEEKLGAIPLLGTQTSTTLPQFQCSVLPLCMCMYFNIANKGFIFSLMPGKLIMPIPYLKPSPNQ